MRPPPLPISSGESSGTRWLPGHREVLLVRPRPGHRPVLREHHPGHRLDEQLRHVGGREPPGVAGDGVVDVGRLTRHRHLAREGERGTPRLARFEVRTAVDRQLLVRQVAQHLGGQHLLDEEVPLEDHLLARLGPDRLEQRDRLLGPVVPGPDRSDERLHVGDAADGCGMPVRPVEPQRGAPVVQDEDDPLTNADGLQEGLEVRPVLDEPVRAGSAVRELVRVAHPDQVRGDAAAQVGEVAG